MHLNILPYRYDCMLVCVLVAWYCIQYKLAHSWLRERKRKKIWAKTNELKVSSYSDYNMLTSRFLKTNKCFVLDMFPQNCIIPLNYINLFSFHNQIQSLSMCIHDVQVCFSGSSPTQISNWFTTAVMRFRIPPINTSKTPFAFSHAYPLLTFLSYTDSLTHSFPFIMLLFPCWQRWQLKPPPNWLAVMHHFAPVIQMSSPDSVSVNPCEIITWRSQLFHFNRGCFIF